MAIAIVVLGCESASAVAVTTAPTAAAKCQAQVAGSSNLVAAGGSGAVTITTQPECEWSAASQAGWITNLSPASGQGSAQVSFQAAPNPAPAARTGEIVVNGVRMQVVQEPAPCVFRVRPGNLAFGPAGGTISTSVSALNGCTWSASADVPWITLKSGAQGDGDGTAMFSVIANTGPLRSATISIAGQTFPVTQDASGGISKGPGSAPAPAPAPPESGGGGGGGSGGGKGKGKGK